MPNIKSTDHPYRRLPRGKARKAIDAIVVCLEYDDLDDHDRSALEDARAALDGYDYQDES